MDFEQYFEISISICCIVSIANLWTYPVGDDPALKTEQYLGNATYITLYYVINSY